jgi:acetyltransferase EpsM
VDGKPILGGIDDLPRLRHALHIEAAVVAIGDNPARCRVAAAVSGMGITLANAIHPSANLADNATVGRNVVVAAGALVCAHCRIADSVILNTGCIVDHESSIGAGAHVCPGARLAGRVQVERGAFLGIGCTVIQCLTIGESAVVGAGAVVIEDVPRLTTVVGVPAHPTHAAHDLFDDQPPRIAVTSALS